MIVSLYFDLTGINVSTTPFCVLIHLFDSLGSVAHQKLSNAIVNRHKKQTKIKVVQTKADPELEKERLEKVSRPSSKYF